MHNQPAIVDLIQLVRELSSLTFFPFTLIDLLKHNSLLVQLHQELVPMY